MKTPKENSLVFFNHFLVGTLSEKQTAAEFFKNSILFCGMTYELCLKKQLASPNAIGSMPIHGQSSYYYEVGLAIREDAK